MNSVTITIMQLRSADIFNQQEIRHIRNIYRDSQETDRLPHTRSVWTARSRISPCLENHKTQNTNFRTNIKPIVFLNQCQVISSLTPQNAETAALSS